MDFFRAMKAFVLVELKTGDIHTGHDNSPSRIFTAPFGYGTSEVDASRLLSNGLPYEGCKTAQSVRFPLLGAGSRSLHSPAPAPGAPTPTLPCVERACHDGCEGAP